MTSREQIREWAVDDVVEALSEEQPEHWAYNVRSAAGVLRDWDRLVQGESTIRGSDACTAYLTRWMNGGVDPHPSEKRSDYERPTPGQVLTYRSAVLAALKAGIAACEDGCDADGNHDPDDVTEAAVEAARGTL